MTNNDIAVHDLGGSGPTVLYAHATGFHAKCWQPLAAHLPQHRNIAYDARGHGDTPCDPDWVVDWNTFGTDAITMAASLQDGGPVLGVGHSMGSTALLMAALEAPQYFRGLVVYEPIVMPPDLLPGTSRGNFLATGARKRRSSFATYEDAVSNYSSKPPLNVLDTECMQQYVRGGFALGGDGSVHLKCRPEIEARTYEAGGNHQTWDRLGELQLPVWVLCGIPQEMQPSARTLALAARIPGARYIQLDHLGHFGPMQAPAEIAAIVGSFTA